ncbi:MAG: hypothetical protein PUB50_04995, partial [Prevotella copri]|nr:hypothetical protein [Segatella copri]
MIYHVPPNATKIYWFLFCFSGFSSSKNNSGFLPQKKAQKKSDGDSVRFEGSHPHGAMPVNLRVCYPFTITIFYLRTKTNL